MQTSGELGNHSAFWVVATMLMFIQKQNKDRHQKEVKMETHQQALKKYPNDSEKINSMMRYRKANQQVKGMSLGRVHLYECKNGYFIFRTYQCSSSLPLS